MHLTVRLAWHDSGWNGRVCSDPRSNTYCTGEYSLLSGRIEKNKDTELEQKHKGKFVARYFDPDSVPPCYWSINACSSKSFKIEHRHPLSNERQPIPSISDEVKPYSVFTWPFKLSFVHNQSNKYKHGNYPPDLNSRINKFIDLFCPKQSVIFFYANYDNPVSADEQKYLLVGCSLISELPDTKDFPFTKEELENWRDSGKRVNGGANSMKNFPKMNWALQFTHDPNSAVFLPYREYIEYAEKYPEDANKLDDMKVVIEEDSLISGFKYVAMEIDDDKCLYLLYKLRKSIKKIVEHNYSVVDSDFLEEQKRIDQLIESVWQTRTVYPSLGKVLEFFLGTENGVNRLAECMIRLTRPDRDLKDLFDRIEDEDIPSELEEFRDELQDLAEIRLFKKNKKGLARLSLFNLTSYQVDRIVNDPNLLQEVSRNPYVLYEEYIATENDLDIPTLQDEQIDIYKLDVGMIPDRRYVKRHRNLQNLTEDSPQRIRSVFINYLKRIGTSGHCYDLIRNLIHHIKENPLIYKLDGVRIDEHGLVNLDSDYKSHFVEKLQILQKDDVSYYYLKNIYEAEKNIKRVILQLVERDDYSEVNFEVDQYIKQSLEKIVIENFDEELFRDERQTLFGNVFRKSFYLITGKPGSGKTFETSLVAEHLNSLPEQVIVLAPTGKAALRLTENIRNYTQMSDVTAETIDRFLNKNFYQVMSGYRKLETVSESEKIYVENLIIDECSMVDLEKLHTLFSLIKISDKYPKRIIMVGDENQLPPIGFGKPFRDIIEFVLSNDNYFPHHYINLNSNCRQENDSNILMLAEAFTDKHRYFEPALDLLNGSGWVSDGLFIDRWSNTESLRNSIKAAIADLFEKEKSIPNDIEGFTALNLLFGLYDSGYVNNQNYEFRVHLQLEALQLLTPYRSGFYGALGLNKFIQENYRERPKYSSELSQFYHSDKIIRTNNWYTGRGRNRELALPNGAIGICTGDKQKRKFYFKELERPRKWVGSEEDYELSYAISVHRAQGSEFRNVFLVVPKKTSLLSKELLYTALTRSKFRLFLFLQDDGDEMGENPLWKFRNVSHLLGRKSSIFKVPVDSRNRLMPDPHGKPVRSRVEYIIYRALDRSGLQFEYERKLQLDNREYDIHPDFTIELQNGKTVFWEHLGMLDVRKYFKDWQKRLADYKCQGLFDHLITTDDLGGISQEKIESVIEDIRTDRLRADTGNRFSSHHYQIY